MKSIAFAVTAMGLVLGLSAPPVAAGSKSLVLVANNGASGVYQQDKCKEGEVWDEDTKKCKKKEG